jgi:UDP-N-acetylmuramyl tripeptide synthase
LSVDDTPPLLPLFDDSRRLPGPNRWQAGPAVVLTPLGPLARSRTAHAAWARAVVAVAAALGWPPPQPQAHRHRVGESDESATLALAAPPRALFAACSLNEWAWEQASASAAADGEDTPAGFVREHAWREAGAATAGLAQAAAQERSRPLERLLDAAAAHGLPAFEDDDTLSVGTGTGSRSWPRAALPMALDLPWPELHARVPIALVTGSNGKTTTTRLLAAMARAAGHVEGISGTDGVRVGGEWLERGDWSGPAGARRVLRDRRCTAALLETARGGIARRGLAVERADVAIVTHVSADHFGEFGIHSLQDLAETKLVVARAVAETGLLVLGGHDAVLLAVADRLPHAAGARRALFALDADEPSLQVLRTRGGSTCGRDARGHLVVHHQGIEHDLGDTRHMPLAAGGAAPYNIENLAAAALAALAGMQMPPGAVREVLHRFGAQPADNPGRLERWQHAASGAAVLIDYAHNPDGLAKLLAVARAQIGPSGGRLLLLLGQAGNRDDAAIVELAQVAAAAAPDRVVVKELPGMLRGRAPGEVPTLLLRALSEAGLPAARCELGGDEDRAAPRVLAAARAGDVVVLPIHGTAGREAVAAALLPAVLPAPASGAP